MGAAAAKKAEVIQTFLSDAIRLAGQAREAVAQLRDQAGNDRVSPALVRSFYQIVHTLKGTASMIAGCEEVCRALESIEGRLACSPVIESARTPDWIADAVSGIDRVMELLPELQRRSLAGAPAVASAPMVRGLMIRASIEGTAKLYWFPLSCLTVVLPADQIRPVSGISLYGDSGKLGVGVQSKSGSAMIFAEEALGIVPWSEAMLSGATQGLAFFESEETVA